MCLSTIENVLLVLLGGFAFCFDLGVFSFREGISEARVHCILSSVVMRLGVQLHFRCQ